MYWRDEWPTTLDGSGPWDGKHLFQVLLQTGKSPFDAVWDVRLLIREVEEKLDVKVTDIPVVEEGANNYVRPCLSISVCLSVCLSLSTP